MLQRKRPASQPNLSSNFSPSAPGRRLFTLTLTRRRPNASARARLDANTLRRRRLNDETPTPQGPKAETPTPTPQHRHADASKKRRRRLKIETPTRLPGYSAASRDTRGRPAAPPRGTTPHIHFFLLNLFWEGEILKQDLKLGVQSAQ